MSIVIDITELHDHPIRTGIQRVVRELLRQWSKRREDVCIARFDPRVGLIAIKPEAVRILLDADEVPAPEEVMRTQLARLAVMASPLAVPDDALVFIPEVFHDPARAQFHHARLRRNSGALAMLAYDFLPWLQPNLFKLASAAPLMPYLRLVRDARHVAFISATTQEDHRRRLTRRDVAVGPVLQLGSDGLRLEKQCWSPTRRGFVALGSIDGRKNQEQIVAAFHQLWERGIDVPLTLVGRRFEGVSCQWLEAACRFVGFRWIGDADDAAVAAVLRRARGTIYVSSSEGFGLPPVESLSVGIPVIVTANIPSVAMMAPGGQLRLPEADPDAIAAAVLTMQDDGVAHKLWKEAAALSGTTWADFGSSTSAWIDGLRASDLVRTGERPR